MGREKNKIFHLKNKNLANVTLENVYIFVGGLVPT